MAKKIKSKKSKSVRKAKKIEKKTKKIAQAAKPSGKASSTSVPFIESRTIVLAGVSTTVVGAEEPRPVFDIELSDIDGDTTIGDLLVVFPRTRDVLFKHGVSFDVEEAGYVYMTLNVFSALHGLKINSLLEELVTASKEVPPAPLLPVPQTGRPLTVTPAPA